MVPDNRYSYVSFSKPALDGDLDRLIGAAATWRPIEGRLITSFDLAGWSAVAEHELTPVPRPGSDTPRAVAEAILDVLLLDRYRRGPVENVRAYADDFLACITERVIAAAPVEIVIPSFPARPANPLTHLRTEPDLGEAAAFRRLAQIAAHVRLCYPPGVRFIICLDGRAYAPFYGYTWQSFAGYPRQLAALVERMGLTGTIDFVDLQSLVDARLEEFTALHHQVTAELRQEWAKPDYPFRDELVESMKLGTNSAAIHAAASKLVKFGEGDEQAVAAVRAMRAAIHTQAHATAFGYMCFLVTIRRLDLLGQRFPAALRGTVHPKPGQYSPYLVNERTRIVPWHGVAVLRPDGEVDCVYESEIYQHPQRYTAVYLDGEATPFYYEQKD
ncbi:L-tyrosine/L-tryptophan isonitrile synthase family protein [Micromonospora sp. NPDC049891]|uniref:L-tyrosine/L-tryptophan isonitrile synthase family protein n=1 Tax=Micromonospora sp. NPDC049891 TaxID=3155655 RepID=UPI0033C4FFED